MFTKEELESIDSNLPEDFQSRSKEFWDYVAEKIKRPRVINRIYFDSLTSEKDALGYVEKNNAECGLLIEALISDGATLYPTEDRLLVEETASWAAMMENGKREDPTMVELLTQSISDRNRFLSNVVNETLKENETGLLFVRPGRDIVNSLPPDIKVIKIQPFEPSDYLNSWLVSKNLRSKKK